MGNENYFLCIFRFDANAPYTATTVGITTQIPRRPYDEWTLRNKNLACIYAGNKKVFVNLKNDVALHCLVGPETA